MASRSSCDPLNEKEGRQKAAMGYASPLPPFFRSPRRFLALGTLLLLPAVARAQAVPRTDTPRAGELRITVEPIITTWTDEFTPDGKQPIAASLTRAIPPRWECFRTGMRARWAACRCESIPSEAGSPWS